MKERILFCDELRGFAALIVMVAHFTIGFNSLKGFLYNPNTTADFYPLWFLSLFPIDGAFGVAIFFLISGFVIPLSLSKKSRLSFLYARAIRIYPVYIFCATITLLIIAGYSNPLKPLSQYITSITLFRDWIGGSPIDGVVWTLEIEVKFYLYVALMAPILYNKPKLFIFIPILITLTLLILSVYPTYPLSGILSFSKLLNVVLYNFGYLVYMNIGVLIYFIYNEKMNLAEAISLICISLAVALYFLYIRYNSNLTIVYIYFFAFCLFIFFYKFRLVSQGIFSGFFAKISFPLYAIHSTLGFVLLSVFMHKLNIYPIFAFGLVVSIVISFSYLVHKYIEVPFLRKSSSIR